MSGNGAGYTLTAAGDVDGDGNLDVAMGDSGAEGMGKVYVWLGPVSGTHDLEDAAIRFTGATAESFGWGLAPIGDADGDGQDDLFVASQNDSTANSSAGTMYVLTGMGEGI